MEKRSDSQERRWREFRVFVEKSRPGELELQLKSSTSAASIGHGIYRRHSVVWRLGAPVVRVGY